MPYWAQAFAASLCCCLSNTLGAATVFFFRKPHTRVLNTLLGASAGIMLAASVWSLLEPALALAHWATVTTGALAGAAFLLGTDKLLARIRPQGRNTTKMLLFSITLHNIPEGLAVGVAFGALAQNPGREALLAAISVAVGIGVQNFPEGAAVSLPLRQAGKSRWRSFLWGNGSGAVEPITAIFGALMVTFSRQALPFLLSFAAGAMLWVCVHELIPACHEENSSGRRAYLPTLGALLGFLMMMCMEQM
ncbi:MAG: ZIP family metal transporter [Oscillospiraceae bacterium]|jgi:ZIP family zinc transporter|nr:ZIP family metal transporter [Oscillospiraceae bacterium]